MEVLVKSDSFRIGSNQGFQNRLFASDLTTIASFLGFWQYWWCFWWFWWWFWPRLLHADADSFEPTSLTSFCSSSDRGTSLGGFAIFCSRLSLMRDCYLFFPDSVLGCIQLQNMKGGREKWKVCETPERETFWLTTMKLYTDGPLDDVLLQPSHLNCWNWFKTLCARRSTICTLQKI